MKKILLSACTALFAVVAQAQLFNDAAVVNSGGLLSDWSTGYTNSAGASYTGNGGAVFKHYGPAVATFKNNGTYTFGTGGMADQFLGPNGAAGAQEISGTTMPYFYDLLFNNGSASPISVTNHNGIRIANSLVFQNGITTTVRSLAASGALKFDAGSSYTASGAGSARHVNGYVAKTGNTAFVFPVGDGAQYCPLNLNTPPPSAGGAIGVAFFMGSPGDNLDPSGGAHSLASISADGIAGSTRIVSISPVCFWDWVPLSGSGSTGFVLTIPDMTGSGGFTSGAELRVVGWNTLTNAWENLGGATGATGTAAGSTISGAMTDMSKYSALALGSISDYPLPVQLISFKGVAESCRIKLSWQTALESNIRHFEVERSQDGQNWQAIGCLAASNSGAITTDYSWADEAALSANYWYRLRIGEVDGSESYSQVIRMQTSCSGEGILVYPNPFGAQVTVSGLAPGSTVNLFALDGRLLFSGNADEALLLNTTPWPAGQYRVQVMRGDHLVDSKTVIKK